MVVDPFINKEVASAEEFPTAINSGETASEPPAQPSEVQVTEPLQQSFSSSRIFLVAFFLSLLHLSFPLPIIQQLLFTYADQLLLGAQAKAEGGSVAIFEMSVVSEPSTANTTRALVLQARATCAKAAYYLEVHDDFEEERNMDTSTTPCNFLPLLFL